MAVFKIRASRVNNADAATFQGQITEEGLIWYGLDGTLRIYNGNPGGRVIGAGGNVDLSGLANVATSGDYLDLINLPTLSDVATSGDFGDLTNLPSIINWNTSGGNDEFRIIDSFTESGVNYTVRNVSISNNRLQLELARFSPTVAAVGQSRAWDQAASAFTITVDNPSDFLSRYIDTVAGLSATVGVHATLADYTAGVKNATPAGGVDWIQQFSTNSTAKIYSNGTGTTGGTATATVTFHDSDGNPWPTTATVSYSWNSVNVTVSFSNLSGKNFLESYNSVSYSVAVTGLSDASNASTQVTATGGTISNATGSGTMTFADPLHKDNNSGRSVSVSTDFSRPEAVTGTAYTLTDTAADTTITATFTYPSFYIWTADTNTPPARSDIVTGSDFDASVTELGNAAKNINTTITNSADTPRAFWLGVRASASQPSTFQTGASAALLSDVAVTSGQTVDLEPDAPGAGYVAERYQLYGITLQPGETYVRIS